MASYIIIKQKGVFKRKLKIKRITEWVGLPYGVSNENSILEPFQLGETIVFFDGDRIGRGFDCSLEGNDIVLHLPLPGTPHDIDLFYQKAADICRKLNVQEVYLDDDKDDPLTASVNQFDELADTDKKASENALRDVHDKVKDQPNESLVIFGAFNPISLDTKRSEKCSGNLDAFEELLHSLQSMDLYYANCMYLRRNSDNSVVGLYAMADGVLTAVPRVPTLLFAKEKIKQYYVVLPGNNTVPYKTFIDNVEIAGEYDANCVIIRLDEQQINNISAKGTVDPITNEPVPCNPYHNESNDKDSII